MAKPIATTPTLTGKDAEHFLEKAYAPISPISHEDYAACSSAYQMMQQMAK